MRIAVLTFEGFNELDSFIAAAMVNRVKQPELRALIVCPAERVASMNGVVVHSQAPLSFPREADAVIVGSGAGTRELVRNPQIMGELRLAGWKAADSVLHYVAPVGEKPQYVERARAAVGPYL